MKKITSPIKWHGGKHYLADWIISHFPKHIHYVEPYFGGGSVLLRKDPEGVSEVVNDIYGDLSNFWVVLSRPSQFRELNRKLETLAVSRTHFEQAKAALDDGRYSGADSTMRALAFFILVRQSRQGLCKDFNTLSRNRTRRGMNEQVSSWLTAIEGLPDVHSRMRRVVVENQEATKVIKQQDGENTLFYLDPPYLKESRTAKNAYEHEMTRDDHIELLETISNIEGKFVLSGYPSALYDEYCQKHDWWLSTTDIDNKASNKKTKQIKTECLWMNFEPDFGGGEL